jgi:hypothetical protein
MSIKQVDLSELDKASEGDSSLRMYMYKDALERAVSLLYDQLEVVESEGYFTLAFQLRLKIAAILKPQVEE